MTSWPARGYMISPPRFSPAETSERRRLKLAIAALMDEGAAGHPSTAALRKIVLVLSGNETPA